jgi:predicted methyltransferase
VKSNLQFKFVAVVIVLGFSACSSTQKKSETTTPLVAATPTPAPVAMTDAEKEQASAVLPKTLQAAVSSSYRTVENANRDRYRHPVATLNFFGLKPKMTVIEITPGAGWYTEILAPFLARQGQFIGAFPPAGENKGMNESTAKVIAWLKAHREFEGHMTVVDFKPPEQLELAKPGSADMVVTFRNVHNWMKAGTQDAVFAAFFKALKPGGILGLEEHRANPKVGADAQASSGYVLEKDLIKMAKKAGFRLVAKSEINANPKDTKDYPEGVWTLPPTLRLKDKDREKYLAIGESDRMTMKFVKPKK